MSVPSPKILVGDCLEQMAKMPDNSVDSIVTDPPYGLEFMGKEWDKGVPPVDYWQEALRVLKPGGHLLSFGGSRTYHRMACAIEDAGFEIRDQIMWVYGSGFPKSLDVSKAMDKAAGVEREVVGHRQIGRNLSRNGHKGDMAIDELHQEPIAPDITAPATPEAKQWEGWGTALKPAHEPIVVARKPLDGTVANNVLAHGTGALNIDGCRVANNGEQFGKLPNWGGGKQLNKAGLSFAEQDHDHNDGANAEAVAKLKALGRFPANFIHDGSDEVLELFPNAKGGTWNTTKGARHFNNDGNPTEYKTSKQDISSGSAARFFYCAKANKKERNAGLEGFPEKQIGAKGNGLARTCGTCGTSVLDGCDCPDRTFNNPARQNHHPTVKPVALMRYLVRLVTPPNGIVFDPFLGSGTTAVAAILEGFEWSGCEITPEYLPIIEGRVAWATEEAAQPVMELF